LEIFDIGVDPQAKKVSSISDFFNLEPLSLINMTEGYLEVKTLLSSSNLK
jgi:hypothetical protein